MAQIRARTGRPARTVIIDTALAMFRQRGVAAVSLSAVAEEIGVTKAAIYHHFKTKDALVLSALEPVLERITSLSGEQMQVHARIDGLIEVAVEHRELLLLAHPHLADGTGPEARQVMDSAASTLITALSPDSTAEARTRATMILASICAVISDPHSTPHSIAELRRVAHHIVTATSLSG